MKKMNVYYTAKDIEEMVARGATELSLGPGDFLTDYARETARQLNFTLVRGEKKQQLSSSAAPAVSRQPVVSDRYNKPSGCQHGPTAHTSSLARSASPSTQAGNDTSANMVDRLVNLMGKVIKRGS